MLLMGIEIVLEARFGRSGVGSPGPVAGKAESWFRGSDDDERLVFRGSSSNTRIDGVWVSSYWPERTAQMKAQRNAPANNRLTGMRK